MLLLTMMIYAVCAWVLGPVLGLYQVYDNLTCLAKGLNLLTFRVRN